jgi:hypothetical protein
LAPSSPAASGVVNALAKAGIELGEKWVYLSDAEGEAALANKRGR